MIKHNCSAIILAGGSSTRFGSDKLQKFIGNKMVIQYSVEAFLKSDLISSVVIVCRDEMLESIRNTYFENPNGKSMIFTVGGNTRLQSSFLGLKALPDNCDYVCIHDAARPLVSEKIITDTCNLAFEYGASAPAVPVKDTIKTCKDNEVLSTLKRDNLKKIQTPQVFYKKLIYTAVEHAIDNNWEITDDCGCVEMDGNKVFLSEGSEYNLKITTKIDLEIAKMIIGCDIQ